MPQDEDWTEEIRKCRNVKEYILIGKADLGRCGHPWKTWDIPINSDKDDVILPYRKEGFKRIDLEHLSVYQICRSDFYSNGKWHHHSSIVAFVREKH